MMSKEKFKLRCVVMMAIGLTSQVILFAQEEVGVNINGVVWATRNVGAPNTFVNKPESDGLFYQWDKNIGWSALNPLTSFPAGKFWSYTNPSGNKEWQKGNNVCPAGWRMPTQAELAGLADVNSEYTIMNGTSGRKFSISSCIPTENQRKQ